MNLEGEDLTIALRAAGEPTRLRILALLRQGDLAVGELVQILAQSQPRLSHHLKTLAKANLVERLPEGSWVFYRAASRGWAHRLLNSLFAELDLRQGEFARDTIALQAVRASRAASAEAYFSDIAEDWDQLRNLHYPNEAIEKALSKMIGPGPFERLIDLGTGTGRMLTLFAPRAKDAEGLDLSHQMLTVARANLARAGITHARVRQGRASTTPFKANTADLIIVHQVLHFIEDPVSVVCEAARLLKNGGRLIIVDFAPHQLEFLRQEHGHHRLGIRKQDMQTWADMAGLNLSDPHHFDPPADLDQGLGVYVWSAEKPANEKEAAA